LTTSRKRTGSMGQINVDLQSSRIGAKTMVGLRLP
jgi:hypothetical protein